MTATVTETEAAFQRRLDENPADGYARQLLADHLDEYGDPRADGYRALGVLGRHPLAATWAKKPEYGWLWEVGDGEYSREENPHVLPEPWLTRDMHFVWARFATRREADDAAALAFARLPEAVRAAILAGATACG